MIGLIGLTGCNPDNSQTNNAWKPQDLKKTFIPMAGNAYQTNSESSEKISDQGIMTWENLNSVFSAYVKFDALKNVKVALRAKAPAGQSTILVKVDSISRKVTIDNKKFSTIPVGEFALDDHQYVKFNLKGIEKEGAYFAQISDLVLQLPKEGSASFVKSNEKNRFYWGRRGPSVHLKYSLPSDGNIEWFYSEVTVPEGQDPIGSYFMANGFSQGYFGIQVNAKDERRVLFSVWSPYQTDDPDEIPESERIQLIKKGEGVTTGKFGNEGSGGQSYWIFPWKAGQTYKFLNRVKPDEEGNTINTAYFYAPKIGEWKLIASFLRPQTDTWLTGAYSFLENFAAGNGYIQRKAFYGNQWFRDKNGQWHEVKEATFTGDDIANTGYRVDFAGGVDRNMFYLKNGGFFVGEIPLKAELSRGSLKNRPQIKVSKLP